jgi:hypothetical protein
LKIFGILLNRLNNVLAFRACLILVCFFSATSVIYAKSTLVNDSITGLATVNYTSIDKDVFQSSSQFIENIGQYGDGSFYSPQMGNVEYGFEGFDMPVLFTKKGIVFLQRKIVGPSEEEREEAERAAKRSGKKVSIEDELEQSKSIDKTIVMQWMGANEQVQIQAKELEQGYHTYGFLANKANGYKAIRYINLYDGIDVEVRINKTQVNGFEYNVFAKPGADLSLIRMNYSGDLTKIKINLAGQLIVASQIDKIRASAPLAYYSSNFNDSNSIHKKVEIAYVIQNNTVSFKFPKGYDSTQPIVIDPFITSTANLTGANTGKAKDIDFDYAGNAYVTGGGDGTVYKLAKFDVSGTLQWTFNGSMTLPTWSFGTYYGGWVVDKTSGNIYLGQGFAPSGGFRIIRISTTGLYDNYITTANPSFLENWKMYWNCNLGSAQLLIAGGGTNSNINMGICSPPSTVISSNNVTGIPYSGGTGWAQDMVDIIIDPLTNDMYTIYGSLIGTTSLTNKIYKNTAPYSGASVAWSTPSGYSTVQEIANRPYLAGPQIDNSGNLLAVNSSYFYYWDGKNLKAFDKASGATVGTPLTLAANTALMSGGIIADECNNVFIGSINGQIKVYKFNGVLFDDAAAPDITIPGYATASVYDLAFYESQKLLFASGNGFVASIDVSSYACNNVTYSIIATPSCATLSVSATVNPAPPAGATVTYTLFNGTTQLGSNTTGTFSSLTPAVTYTLKAFINLVCSGVVTVTNFVLPGPTISISSTNPTCGNSNGSITAVGGAGTAPFTFSKDGITFQASGLFTGLTSGVYTITVKDANGCTNTALVTLLNSNGPTATISKTDAICGTSNGSVTVNLTGGIAPMTYSVNGVTFQSSNFFTGLVAGNYSVTLKDANGCKNVYSFSILNLPGPQVTAIPSATFCNSNNGSINAYGTGGVAPLQYSINGNIYQSSGLFTALAPGSYTVTVKDANGCINTVSVTVANSPAPTVSAIATAATCNNANGTITATGVGGTAPLMYSIDGISFQSSPYFYGLTAGVYTITVKDFYNCINTVNVTVTNTSAPQITVTTTPSACSTNTGTITATGSLGIAPLQYSINGINFQASTLFSGLNTGNYLVQVKDANGCMSAAFAVILNTAAPTLNLVVTPTSCSASDGVITANGIGGTAPLQYSIDGVNYQASSVFSSLATGNYTISVKDANGCISTASATVNNIAGLSVTATNVSSVCTTNNGFITASGSGGVAPLQYSINGVTFQASPLFTNLGGGIYTITVKDANGCKATTIVNLAVAAQPQLSATVVNTNCASSNGSISIVGSSGTPPYQYSINGITYQSNSTFLNIAAGTYTVYIKDAANCIQTTSVTLTNSGVGPGISTFTVSVDDAYICNGSLGKIKNPKVNGATCATCTYSLNNGAFVPNATNLFLNVSPGTYTVTAMDANGCTKTISVTIAIAVNSTATAVVTPANCGSSNGSITITGIGPNTPYHSSITGIGGPWASWDPTYTYSGLAPGTYIITLADDESFDSGPPIDPGGCIETITVIVPAIGGASLSLSKTDGTCNLSNGSITALGSGGIAPYDYSIDGITYQSSGLFTNLAAGTYTVTVMDGTGCETSGTITVGNSGGPTVTATVTPATCGASNGTILATGVGAAPLQYSINTTLFQAASTFSGLAAGTYTVYVKDVANCYSTTTVVISNAPKPKVTAFAVAATCNSNNGALVAVGSLGASPYQFSIDGVTFQSNTLFLNLSAGNYTITIKDANGCISTTVATVTNLLAPTLTLLASPASCFNANGTITATVVGGVTPYQYSLNGGLFQASNVFSSVISGSQTVTIKDANGCVATKNIVVTNTLGPQNLTATFVNPSCGNSNGSITATASGGVAPLQYSINGITFQASTSFTNVGPGLYTLTVKDANGCTKNISVSLINLAPPSLSVSSTASSCFANDGTITVVATGGTGALTYSINGINFQVSNVFTGLASGNYTVTVKDAKNCTATIAVSVGSLTGVSVTAIPTAAGCMAATGSITATGLGGTTPYQYSLDGITYQVSNVFSALAAGAYTVTIKDASNCINTTAVVNVVNTSGATVTAISSNATCGASNGSIAATGLGGTTPYQFSLDGITYQASNIFTGLAAGAYTVTIKDASNCINTTAVVNVVNTSGATVTAISSNTTCGASNGSITATGLGGTTPYQYSLDGITYQASNIFTGLAAGAYTVTIKDASNCINTTAVVNVVNTSGATVTAISSNATCGASNGSITATGLGGTTPYQYSLDGITYQASNVFTGLAAGAYTVTIKDASNCINTTAVVNVVNTSGATVTAISSNATCGASNGSITSTGLGGTTPYQYSLDGITYQASNIFTGLAAGAYTVTIKDGNNCINTSAVVNVVNTSGATVTAISSNATCGSSNGSITATGLGGITPYQYSLDGITYQASNIFTGLAAGAYTVTIKDASNCINTTAVVNVVNTSGATVTAINSNATCGASNGSITATGLGGTTPYQYSLDGITYQASNVFSALAAGAYTVTIKDANNCINTSAVVNIVNTSGATVTAISSNTTCGASNGSITATGLGGTTPYQYSLDGITYQASNVFSALAAGAYTVTIKDASNCINTTAVVNIVNTSGATVTAISSNATCGASNGSITATGLGGTTPYQYSLDGITYQASNIFTGLAAGAYTVTIKDASNCINTSAIVNILNTSGATVTAISSNATCGASNGSITATGLGGTTPYQYSLDGITYQASNIFTGLAAGAYTVTIKDANNCINTSAVVNIVNTSGATVTAISSNTTCGASNGSITATGLGGTTPYQYSLDGITYQVSNVFTGLAAGAYTVTIKDASNCINTTAVVNVVNTSGATVTAINSNATCGTSNGSITATGLGGTTPYQYSLDGITYQVSNIFTGLAAGAYTVTIKDASNCINTTAVVNIVNTSGATVTAISSNATCGSSNGSITATGLGGTTPYQFSLDGITYQASNIFTGLAAGAYTVTIKDASNCINTTAVVNVVNTSGATVTAISSNATCGASNGSITATGLGGTTPYQFSLDGITYQASNIFTGLAAGAYTVTIKDASNCINTTAVVNIVNTSGATVTAISSNTTCGASNGSITATGLGGATPYQYSLDGITYQVSNIFTGLAAGAYTVTIKDANNCINTSSILNVNSNSGATVTAISNNTTCGANNGSITSTGLGGTTPYQYSLDGITYQVSNIFTGLAAGAYTVTIKDASNCINNSAVVNVVNTSGATVTAISSNTTCGASNGSITATGLGGTTPYQYSLDGITYQASNIFTGLAAGAYTITIKDANNCINTSAVVNVVNTSGATVTAISSNTTCGASNGSITATGFGGTTPYQYSLDGITYQVSNIFTALAAGAYTVTIKDASNCINTTAVVNIVNTSGATVTAISSNTTCGSSNGSITATGLGGTTPYQYSLDGITYQASNIYTGLAAGVYTVTIKDGNNCINTSSIINVNSNSGATVTAISSNATCGASNGSITATGLGGTTPYQYSLDGITYQASNIFTGLAAGAYTVTIKDANNCINTSSIINVNSNSGATVTAISSYTTCGASNGSITATGLGGTTPYQYSLDGITYQASNIFTGLAAGAYTVTIKDANNCINTSSIINVNSNSGATVTAISSNTTCGASNGSITATGLGGTTPYQYSLDGITYQVSNIFTGLAAGAYTVTIKDANNCINTSSIINVNSNSGATVTAISSNTTCGASNGSITATGLGGTTPYQYSLDGITYQASNVFTGLAAGAYTVTIKDANNCINTSSIINVNSNSGATVTAISSNTTCGASNGSITATGLGGTTPYQYSLDGITYQASNIFTGLAAGAYTVTIKDGNNCINTSSIINVNSNSGATVTAISSNATCGASNGSITATGLGGTTPYQYSLDGITYQVSNIFTGLAAGAYTVTIKDANNCINTSSIINVNSNSGATVTTISSNTTCGASNGSITATGLGGTTPYQYSLDGITYQVSNIFTGLAAGAYTVTIKDASNCINTSSAVVNVVNTTVEQQ